MDGDAGDETKHAPPSQTAEDAEHPLALPSLEGCKRGAANAEQPLAGSRRAQLLDAIQEARIRVGEASLAKDSALAAEAKHLAEWDRLEDELEELASNG